MGQKPTVSVESQPLVSTQVAKNAFEEIPVRKIDFESNMKLIRELTSLDVFIRWMNQSNEIAQGKT